MPTRRTLTAAMFVLVVGGSGISADEVRYYEKDGITYREVRQTVQKRVPEIIQEDRTQTVYREECVTEMRDVVRTRWVPVTEYQVEERLVGRWNPLVRPYFQYRTVPRTRWELRSETVQVPVVCRKLVPETRVVRVPTTRWRTVEEEIVSRVAVSIRGSGSPAASIRGVAAAAPLVPVPVSAPARQDPIGGLSRLESDPPRKGTSSAWRASGDGLRR